MIVDLQEISLSGIILGVVLLFLGSLLNIPELYFLGFLIFVLGVILIVIQWIISGGVVELLNWLPLILIFTIISALSSDFVSSTTSTQNLTWPLIGIILAVIVFFILFQGGDLDFLVPFSPVIFGVAILGCIFGFVYFSGDWIRGLAYGIGVLGIIIYACIIYYLSLPEVVSIFSVQRPDHITLYFDENFPRMIREWDLLSRSKAREFKLQMLRRLVAISNDIDRIQAFRNNLNQRLDYLDREMKKLEVED